MRTIVFWGLHWGPFILGNYHMFSFAASNSHSEFRVSVLLALGKPSLKHENRLSTLRRVSV